MITTGLSDEFGNNEAMGMYKNYLKDARHSGIYHLPPTQRSLLEKAASKTDPPLPSINLSTFRHPA